MYTEHFGLKALPFENVPDPVFFFDSGDYERVLRRMTDALTAGRGLLAVAGPIGAGKTTLSQKLMADLDETTKLVWLAEPPETAMDLFFFLSQEIGVKDGSSTRVFLLRDLRKRLLALNASGGHCLMVVDESHLMSDETLEGIRLLNNFEQGASKLIQIILLGQQELIERFARPEMEAFRQRIAGLEVIGKMDPERIRRYILHRLEVAGRREGPFTASALETAAGSTGGVPRVTNSLCDRSLRIAYEEGKDTVDADEVHRAAMDLGLGRRTMRYMMKLRSEGSVGPAGGQEEEQQPPPPVVGSEAAAVPAAAERAEKRTDAERSTEIPEKKGLAAPVLFFLSSLAALAASLWLYCGRTGAPDPGGCLGELLRTFSRPGMF